jgi:hypothetical protein
MGAGQHRQVTDASTGRKVSTYIGDLTAAQRKELDNGAAEYGFAAREAAGRPKGYKGARRG